MLHFCPVLRQKPPGRWDFTFSSRRHESVFTISGYTIISLREKVKPLSSSAPERMTEYGKRESVGLTDQITLNQDANNIDGERIEFNNLNSNKYTTYAYIYWNSTFKNNWAGQYTLLAYNQPSTEKQSGNSKGVSFSFSQYLGNIFNIFGRINGSSGNITTIKQSYVVGFGFKNLFKRNINDYLGFAFTTNKLNERAIDTPLTHRYENIIEAQYVIGLGNYITITPDIQYIINPALDIEEDSAFVYSLRLGVSI